MEVFINVILIGLVVKWLLLMIGVSVFEVFGKIDIGVFGKCLRFCWSFSLIINISWFFWLFVMLKDDFYFVVYFIVCVDCVMLCERVWRSCVRYFVFFE